MTAVEHPAADRAAAYGLEPIVVDGNDVDAVFAVATDGRSSAPGPATGRRSSRPSPTATAATRGPIPASTGPTTRSAAWKARDPIPAYRARLEAAGVDAAELDAIEAETRDAVAAAEAEARAAPEPAADVLETQVWADGGSAWRN